MDMKLSWGDVGTVVLSGILIVFVVLIILIAIVWIYGQIFHAINKSKADKASGGSAPGETSGGGTAPNITVNAVTQTPAETDSEDGIPGSVIAAISAAVAAFTGGKGVVAGITRKKALKSGVNSRRRSTEWGQAGTVAAMKTLNRIGR
jgi:Na+-transporting methylmalonyl-CoA/oxaloacetate decarboxylase gamma subunit